MNIQSAYMSIQIATLFSSATLSVENAYAVPSAMLSVLQHDFINLRYVMALDRGDIEEGGTGDLQDWKWTGPIQPLEQIASAVSYMTPPPTYRFSHLVCSYR